MTCHRTERPVVKFKCALFRACGGNRSLSTRQWREGRVSSTTWPGPWASVGQAPQAAGRPLTLQGAASRARSCMRKGQRSPRLRSERHSSDEEPGHTPSEGKGAASRQTASNSRSCGHGTWHTRFKVDMAEGKADSTVTVTAKNKVDIVL